MSRKAIVIGSGLGGIAAAIRLQAAGFETTIFEKRDQPGGRAYVFRDHGFTFDAGPTVITAPHCLEELFELSGRKLSDYVELMPVEPFYRLLWDDGYQFDYGSSIEETLEQIRRKSPGDEQGYLNFLRYSEEVFNEGYTKLVHVPFLNWWSMIRVSPQLARLSAHRSVYSQVSKFIQDPHLRQAFSFHSLLVGGNPFDTSSIYTLIHFLERKWGVFFPKGGTGALVQGLLKLFHEMGGQIKLNAEVDSIIESTGKVHGLRLQNGETHQAEVVVSNADVMHTYKDLLNQVTQLEPRRKRLEKMRYSMSLFLIYFGTKKQYPEMAHHTVIFCNRYKALLEDIFHKGIVPDDFSLYLHAPTRSDSDLAPPGHEGFYVLAPVPNMSRSDFDWATEGERYADKILDYLEQKCLPGLRENLVTKRIFTPLDFKQQLNAHQGSAFSLEPVLTQSAFFRTHNREAKLSGLYFVGAGTHPGAGVPGVVNSAKATVNLIQQDYARV
jgi:phytoene desaturase